MSNRIISCLIILLVTLVWFSCRETDAQRPSIEVFSPQDGQGWVACDEVIVSGRATDNRGLSEVTVSLRDVFNGQQGSVLATLSGTEDEFSLTFKLGDRYTPTGEYIILVTVFDQSGNSASESIPLTLSELPRVLQRPIWTGEDASGGSSLFYLDSLDNVQNGPFLGNQLSDLVVDNRNRLLLFSELYGGLFAARLLSDFSPEFQANLPTGTLAEGITDIATHVNKYYLAVNVPPYLLVYDPQGEQIESWDEVLYPARQVLANSDNVWVSVKGITGSPIKTDNYRENSRQLVATNVLGWVSEYLFLLENGDVLAGGNENGQGSIKVLDGAGLGEQAGADLLSELLDLDGEGADWFALLPSGLWRFNPDNGTANGPLVGGVYSSIAWEAEQERIYLGRENAVDVFDANGNLLQSYLGGFGTVKLIDFQYNK